MIHRLFVEKWDRFGYNIWVVHRILDLCYLVPLVSNSLWLKEAPLSALQATWLPATGSLADANAETALKRFSLHDSCVFFLKGRLEVHFHSEAVAHQQDEHVRHFFCTLFKRLAFGDCRREFTELFNRQSKAVAHIVAVLSRKIMLRVKSSHLFHHRFPFIAGFKAQPIINRESVHAGKSTLMSIMFVSTQHLNNARPYRVQSVVRLSRDGLMVQRFGAVRRVSARRPVG